MSMRERAVVGRKTPDDGKLEISSELAEVLGGDGALVLVQFAGGEQRGHVTVMECTCAKAATSGVHLHHFLQCDAFREVAAGTALSLSADRASVQVELGA